MVALLAQLVAPPVQTGPVRLPQSAPIERPAPEGSGEPPTLVTPQQPEPPAPQAPAPAPAGEAPPRPTLPGAAPLPRIEGTIPYGPRELRRLLAPCLSIADPAGRLEACASLLTTRLLRDGYVNSRVFVQAAPAAAGLLVVEGRLVELRVEGPDARLNSRVRRLMQPQLGQVLNVPNLEESLLQLRNRPGVGSLRASLTRLGSDVSQAVLLLRVQPGRAAWHGDLAARNDGSSGSGEARLVGTLVKADLATRGDTLLLYGELDGTDAGALGALISSISYTLPLAEQLNLTGAFGSSRRTLVELPEPVNGLTTNQLQAFGQLEWVLHDSLRQRWSLSAGLSGNGSSTSLDGAPLPPSVPASVRVPRSGYLRLALNGAGQLNRVPWNGNLYLLQGLGFATPADQLQELASGNVVPGQARAIGAIVSALWGFAPRWQLLLRGGGQVALQPLTSSMQFTLGSDVGIRGLPGQLVSGDSGWLATGEVAWTFWQNRFNSLQLVPFLGAGGVTTQQGDFGFQDSIGAGGLLVRWLQGNHWTTELGWVDSFNSADNSGPWSDWLLGRGLYARVQFRF